MVSLNYDAATGLLCGTLATEMVNQLQAHRHEIHEPSSFRFHMSTSLGGALLILATLLSRDLSTIGLQSHCGQWAAAFNTAIEMLDELGKTLGAARRITGDLENVVTSVKSIRSRPPVSTQSNTTDLTLRDFDTVFSCADQEFPRRTTVSLGPAVPDTASQAQYPAFDYEVFASVDNWDTYFQPDVNGYGVPWL